MFTIILLLTQSKLTFVRNDVGETHNLLEELVYLFQIPRDKIIIKGPGHGIVGRQWDFRRSQVPARTVPFV